MTSNKALVSIFLVVAVDVLGLTIVIPLLPFYAEEFGASPIVVGLLFASFAVCQFLAGPILGRISDRIGRRPTLIFSQIGTFIGFLVLGFANSLFLLFIARIIDGVTAGNLSIAQAYISDVTKPEERTKAFGFIGIAFGLGFLIGPAMSGFLSDFGHSVPAFAAAGLSLTSIICTIVLLPSTPVAPSPSPRKGRLSGFSEYLRRPATRRSLLEFFAFALAFALLIGGLAMFLERQFGFKARETGYLFAFSGLMGAIVQGGLVGRLATAWGEVKLSTVGFFAMAISYIPMGFIHDWRLFLIGVVVGGFGSSVTRPALTTLLTKSVGPHEQGEALGVSQSLNSIAQIIGPILAGVLIEQGQLVWYGIVAAVIAFWGMSLTLQSKPPELSHAAQHAE
ncbi:MAG: MFS transporter [Chlorobi bacterium]|nr:MAG: Major facilitator superfamily permease [Chlorobi bacterium OLB7]MBK8912473.1 MFS transporter [Chlorobiota bacterium]MBX7216282.1 MFS transporter [Candidatus Kapabacteria bacterium]